jgi:hypothetical protein
MESTLLSAVTWKNWRLSDGVASQEFDRPASGVVVLGYTSVRPTVADISHPQDSGKLAASVVTLLTVLAHNETFNRRQTFSMSRTMDTEGTRERIQAMDSKQEYDIAGKILCGEQR